MSLNEYAKARFLGASLEEDVVVVAASLSPPPLSFALSLSSLAALS